MERNCTKVEKDWTGRTKVDGRYKIGWVEKNCMGGIKVRGWNKIAWVEQNFMWVEHNSMDGTKVPWSNKLAWVTQTFLVDITLQLRHKMARMDFKPPCTTPNHPHMYIVPCLPKTKNPI